MRPAFGGYGFAMPDELLGALIAFCIAVATTPAGVSGAVFLLPVQVSILGVPNPAVTPTNLLYNVVATPGALLRFRSAGRLGGPLVRAVTLGTLPGVVVGALLRVEVLSGPETFLLVIAAVLVPLGVFLASTEPPREDDRAEATRSVPARVSGLAAGVGVVGGIYGIGGGSLIGPLLVAMRYSPREVVPAAIAATFATSLVGVATFTALDALGDVGDAAPDWGLGLLLGAGGLAGSYAGATLQERVPEALLRRGLGGLAVILGVYYVAKAIA
jgi:hypothetical protein